MREAGRRAPPSSPQTDVGPKGGRVFVRLGDLEALVASILQSHSYPPQDPRES
jgi:hypothetical protein